MGELGTPHEGMCGVQRVFKLLFKIKQGFILGIFVFLTEAIAVAAVITYGISLQNMPDEVHL